jgi:hypothetical protein
VNPVSLTKEKGIELTDLLPCLCSGIMGPYGIHFYTEIEVVEGRCPVLVGERGKTDHVPACVEGNILGSPRLRAGIFEGHPAGLGDIDPETYPVVYSVKIVEMLRFCCAVVLPGVLEVC